LSTILDALKRLEKDGKRPENSISQNSWLDAPSVDEPTLGKAAGFLLSRSRTFWAVCAVVLGFIGVLALVGTEMLPRTQHPEQPAAKTLVREPAMPVVPESAGPPEARRSPTGKKTAKLPPQRSTAHSSPAPAKKMPAGPQPAKSAAQKTLPAAPVAGRPFARENAGSIAPKKTEPVRTPPPAPAAEEGATPVDAVPAPEQIESLPAAAGFALQAISWSDQPDRRIAVINGSILKEGEKIKEYTVFEIHRDDVIFQHQGQRWRLDFQKK
jgi:hypothetical protein